MVAKKARSTRAPRKAGRIEVHPVTADRWADLAALFGEKGACAGCWCLFFKQDTAEHREGRGEKNRRAQQRYVQAGHVPGLLAYVDGEPAAWCAVEPRERYKRIVGSRTTRPVDDRPAWAVPCFFVARPHRRTGLTVRLLEAACDHARAHGATLLEGYPVAPLRGRMPDTFAYHGLEAAFEKAGFREVARPSSGRRVMRRELSPRRSVRRRPLPRG